MAKYSELISVLTLEKNSLFEKIRELRIKETNDKKIRLIVNKFKESNENVADYSKIEKLRFYFPQNNKGFDLLKRLVEYKVLIEKNQISRININEFIRDIKFSSENYGIPSKEILDDVIMGIQNSINIMQGKMNLSFFEKKIPFPTDFDRKKTPREYMSEICYSLALHIIKAIEKVLNEEKKKNNIEEKISIYEEKVNIIDSFLHKFSSEQLLTPFTNDNELEEFIHLIESLMDKEKCIEILKMIREDQSKKDIVVETITFANLDLSRFTNEERLIIEELREIYEDERIVDGKNIFNGVEISYESRLLAYKNVSINDLLLDVKNNLLPNIYDNKEVIKIFHLIIKMYEKNNLRIIREEVVRELLKIINDFENIINFIHKTYKDQGKAFDESQIIKGYIDDINKTYLPLALEIKDNDMEYEDEFDGKLDDIITQCKTIIKKWKKEMTSYYREEFSEERAVEDTDNLVFCINDEIDLSDEGHQKEFVGAIEALEMKSSHDLKRGSGRKGMTRLRKSTEGGDEKDFVDYVNYNILHTRSSIHFVPYRYSNNPYYRTGLIKFEPSQVVKEFLERRYGLSKQSAIYGVFQVIRSMGADHSEYKFFEEYLLGNYQRIEEIALLFASDSPDFDELTKVIEQMLKIKRDKLAGISSKK